MKTKTFLDTNATFFSKSRPKLIVQHQNLILPY